MKIKNALIIIIQIIFFNQQISLNPNINFQDIINITNNIKKEINSGLMDSLLDNLYEYDNKDDLLVKYNNIIF